MLYFYPDAALDQNWLNPMNIEVLRCGMDTIDDGTDPDGWPDCTPAEKREFLRPRYGFGEKISDFWQSYRDLYDYQMEAAREAISHQTNLPDVLSNDDPCRTTSYLPAGLLMLQITCLRTCSATFPR
jgi:hypothetical protein